MLQGVTKRWQEGTGGGRHTLQPGPLSPLLIKPPGRLSLEASGRGGSVCNCCARQAAGCPFRPPPHPVRRAESFYSWGNRGTDN